MKLNNFGYDGAYGRAIGDENRKTVWDFLQHTPQASARRIAAATGISHHTTLKAVRAINAGWTPAHMGGKK